MKRGTCLDDATFVTKMRKVPKYQDANWVIISLNIMEKKNDSLVQRKKCKHLNIYLGHKP